jgi:hypothetical protein
MIIEPECERGAHYIRLTSHNAREEHICYDNLARVREWSTFYKRIELEHRRVAPGSADSACAASDLSARPIC